MLPTVVAGMAESPVVVVGAGAAGLAVSWHLRQRGRPFVILDAGARPGDSWRSRYDSLRLFTPARFCELPGLPMRVPPQAHPDKDEMADYLAHYAETFDLPVRADSLVRTHRFDGGGHRLSGDDFAIATDCLTVSAGPSARESSVTLCEHLCPAGVCRDDRAVGDGEVDRWSKCLVTC